MSVIVIGVLVSRHSDFHPLADVRRPSEYGRMVDRPPMSLGTKLAFAVGGLIVFGAATLARDSDFGAATTFSVGAISVAVYACWNLHKRLYFWPVISTISVVHAMILLRWSVHLLKPTIVVAPVVYADFVAIVALLFGIDRLLYGLTSE